jgi:UvrD-like helicase family protein
MVQRGTRLGAPSSAAASGTNSVYRAAGSVAAFTEDTTRDRKAARTKASNCTLEPGLEPILTPTISLNTTHPKRPCMTDGQLTFDSITRFKGQESPAVIIVDIDPDPADLEQAERLLLSGMTRATLRLELLVRGDNPLNDRLQRR